MNFEQFALDPLLLKALTSCGHTIPTPIQEKAIPIILSGKDIVATAQTGTGKTAAYLLPTLHKIHTHPLSTRKTRILILAPTRELAIQITQVASDYGKFINLRTVSLIGGLSYHQQINKLSQGATMIVATPGRLIDYLENRHLDLSGIETLILDEADRMLDMGFIPAIRKIVRTIPNQRQTLLFSATANDQLQSVLKDLVKQPTRVNLSQNKIDASLVKQKLYFVDNSQHKMQLLQYFLKETQIYKAIIFSATKRHAKRLAEQLCKQGHNASALHGDLKQNARNRTVLQLRNGKIQYLVATDVAARGLDVLDISHIINYDLPKVSEDYVHRIGRTGRAGNEGIAISLVAPSEMCYVKNIERFIGKKLQRDTIKGLEPHTYRTY